MLFDSLLIVLVVKLTDWILTIECRFSTDLVKFLDPGGIVGQQCGLSDFMFFVKECHSLDICFLVSYSRYQRCGGNNSKSPVLAFSCNKTKFLRIDSLPTPQ